jgi:hypothetical protein
VAEVEVCPKGSRSIKDSFESVRDIISSLNENRYYRAIACQIRAVSWVYKYALEPFGNDGRNQTRI